MRKGAYICIVATLLLMLTACQTISASKSHPTITSANNKIVAKKQVQSVDLKRVSIIKEQLVQLTASEQPAFLAEETNEITFVPIKQEIDRLPNSPEKKQLSRTYQQLFLKLQKQQAVNRLYIEPIIVGSFIKEHALLHDDLQASDFENAKRVLSIDRDQKDMQQIRLEEVLKKTKENFQTTNDNDG